MLRGPLQLSMDFLRLAVTKMSCERVMGLQNTVWLFFVVSRVWTVVV